MWEEQKELKQKQHPEKMELLKKIIETQSNNDK